MVRDKVRFNYNKNALLLILIRLINIRLGY